MKPYWSMWSARFRLLLQYRAAALAGLFTQLVFGFIYLMIYRGFYAASHGPQPMSLEELTSYVWLNQAMLLLIPWRADDDVAHAVRTGGVVYEMLRPVDLYWFWYSRALARRVAPVLLRCIPMFIVAFAFLGLQPPPSIASGFAWGAATITSALLSTAWATLLAISLMWTLSGEGVNVMSFSVVMLFSGAIVPLPFFPEWAQRIVYTLPFRGIVDIPYRLYLGHIPPNQAPKLILLQLFWVAVLVTIGRLVLHAGKRRLVVQGG